MISLFKLKYGDGSQGATVNFALQVIQGRWFMIVASLLIMSMAGMNYSFSLYSNTIKSSMGYDQRALTLISVSKDIGVYLGIIPNLVSQVIEPPWVVISIGAVMNFCGYLMIWLAITGHLKNVSLWQMCVFIFIGCHSQAFISTGTVATCVKNFPQSRGMVLGLITGNVALCGAILTQLYHAFYGTNSKSIILLFSWLPSAIYICFLAAVRVKKDVQKRNNEAKGLYNILYVSLFLAGFLMVTIIVQNMINFNRVGYYATAFTVVFIIFFPFIVAIKQDYCINQNHNNNDPIINQSEQQTPIRVLNDDPKNHNNTKSFCISNIFKPPKRGEDYTILQAIFTLDMLLLFVSFICGLGGSGTATDNMAQIGISLGYSTHSITTFVTLVSIWNYLGRVVSGFVSDFALIRYNFPRPVFLTTIILISCVGHLLAFGVPNSLYVASVIIGFCLGAQFQLVTTIASDIFCLKYYAWIFNFILMAIPIGTYVFNAVVTGKLYDRIALHQLYAKGLTRKAGEDLNCYGAECYRLPFIIITGFSLFASLISFILVLRTWKFYRGDVHKKFTHK